MEIDEKNMSIDDLAKITHRSRVAIYKVAQKLGRKPTIEEIIKRKSGRPRKYN